MDLNISDKVAIVTGGASGIGRGIALRLAGEGANVVIPDLAEKDAEETVAEIRARGGAAIALRANAADETEIDRFIAEAKKAYGSIDILVNNVAGGAGPSPIVKMTTQAWDNVVELTLKSTFLCSRAVAREMVSRKRGRIINIASLAGRAAEPLMGSYSSAKFGVVGLTQVMAKELGRYGITVNAVCPGFIYTPGFERFTRYLKEMYPALKNETPEAIFMRRVREATVLGRPQTAEEVGSLVTYLASEEAANITGQTISVDGGAFM